MRNRTSNLPVDSNYVKFLRAAVFLSAIFAWCLSIWWSSEGFSIRVPGYEWLGVGLGIFLVTIPELLFNRGSKNPTIWIVGLFAYAYGLGTNIAGINQFLGLDISSSLLSNDFWNWLVNSAIVYGLAGIVEIAPESFILWAIYPDSTSFGDFITSLLGGSGLKIENRPQNRSNMSNFGRENSFLEQKTKQNGFKEQNKTFYETKQTKQYPYRVNWTNIAQNTNIYKVLIAHREYWNKTGRECPNKTLVRQTGVSKGQVSSIVSKLKASGFA